jgi:hypothetical protein
MILSAGYAKEILQEVVWIFYFLNGGGPTKYLYFLNVASTACKITIELKLIII